MLPNKVSVVEYAFGLVCTLLWPKDFKTEQVLNTNLFGQMAKKKKKATIMRHANIFPVYLLVLKKKLNLKHCINCGECTSGNMGNQNKAEKSK